MDLLVCPSCARRYAVRGAGSLGGWRCSRCSSELEVIERKVSRIDLFADLPRASKGGHLQMLPLEQGLGPAE